MPDTDPVQKVVSRRLREMAEQVEASAEELYDDRHYHEADAVRASARDLYRLAAQIGRSTTAATGRW